MDTSPLAAERAAPSAVVAWGRLLRISLAPSAVADALCGIALGAGGWPGALVLVAPCVSLGLYHGGMALNDWADRAADAHTRPKRPLPAGHVSASAALGAGLIAIAAAVALAAYISLSAFLVAACVAALVLAYDFAGRGAWLGPGLLAACRGGNLLLGATIGAAVAGRALAPDIAVPVLLYAAYVAAVSRLGRLEDALDERPGARPRRLLQTCGAVLMLAPLAVGAIHGSPTLAFVGTAVAALGALGIFTAAHAHSDWSHDAVTAAMGIALRRLVVFTAAVACAAGEPWFGFAILVTFPIGVRLRRVFPPS